MIYFKNIIENTQKVSECPLEPETIDKHVGEVQYNKHHNNYWLDVAAVQVQYSSYFPNLSQFS